MDQLARAATDRPSAAALLIGERVITYEELDAAAWGVADAIRSSGSFGSHPIAFWGDRTAEGVAAVWGIPRAGVTAIPVDPRLPPARAMEATRTVGVRGLWTPPGGGFDRLMARGAEPKPGVRGEYVVFTSGSEGAPKGVRLTPENIEASVAGSVERLGHGADDAWLCVLPLFHVGGLAILWRQAATSAPVVLHDSFDPAGLAAAFGDVAFASVVPTMLHRALRAGAAGHDGLRAVLVGGAASDRTLLEGARDRGIPAVPTYGMTETCSQIATPRPGDPLDGTVGTPIDGAEIRVVQDGAAVLGTEGRLEVRGPMVSPGVVGEPERLTGEWYVTGDLGIVDGSGRVRVLGRADSVIVTGGENVHPAAVEAALRAFDGIDDVRVYGVPDSEWGTIVAADIQTELDSRALDEMAASLPSHMRPRRWQIVSGVRAKLDGS